MLRPLTLNWRPLIENEAAAGRFSHLGAEAPPAEEREAEQMLTFPSNEAAESSAGILGDHCTSKFQLALGGSSHVTAPVKGDKHSVRLSLPDVSRRLLSNGLQLRLVMPALWTAYVKTG